MWCNNNDVTNINKKSIMSTMTPVYVTTHHISSQLQKDQPVMALEPTAQRRGFNP